MEPQKFTTDDLAQWLDDFVNKFAQPRSALHVIWPPSPRGRAFKRVVEIAYSFSAQSGEAYSETKARLTDAAALFLDLMTTTTRGRVEGTDQWFESEIWYHRDDLFYEFNTKGYPGDHDFEWQENLLGSFGASLVARPWLNSSYMEWVIVDSLVCNHVRQFGQSILENPFPGFGPGWLLGLLATGDRKKGCDHLLFRLMKARLILAATKILMFFILPGALVWYGLHAGSSPIAVTAPPFWRFPRLARPTLKSEP